MSPEDSDLRKPYPADKMKAYPVSTRVNMPKNDNVSPLERIDPPHPEPRTPLDVHED